MIGGRTIEPAPLRLANRSISVNGAAQIHSIRSDGCRLLFVCWLVTFTEAAKQLFGAWLTVLACERKSCLLICNNKLQSSKRTLSHTHFYRWLLPHVSCRRQQVAATTFSTMMMISSEEEIEWLVD